MPKIIFLMPCFGIKPMGGFKVVYEYANRLINDNYDVAIVYPISSFQIKKTLKGIIKIIYNICLSLFRQHKECVWFNLDSRITKHAVWDLSEKHIPTGDYYFATGASTAIYLNTYQVLPQNKFYLIQGYENWDMPECKLHETYHYDLRKIVIAEWLREKLYSLGVESTLIHNGFDFNYFQKYIDIQYRNKYSVIMPYNKAKLKGWDDGLAAIEIVRRQYPKLKITIFSACNRPPDMPKEYNFIKMPNKEIFNKIYNESAIFIGPSLSEGFCLTPPEAMMCGCAVVCTDIGGYTVVCKHNVTALTSPMNNPLALANNIITLIQDDELRISIANAGHLYIKQFTWERAYRKLKYILECH